MINKVSRNKMRVVRHERIRSKVHGTTAVPRLSIFRSNTNIGAQIIDDENAITLVSASSLKMKTENNIETATKVGEAIAEAALKAGIKQVVFDRGGYLYHGRVKALAEAAREKGLEF